MSDNHALHQRADAANVRADVDSKTRFTKRAWLTTAVSILVLIPCFWHRRIEAGDLGSHVYNAWLVTLIEQGRAPGLYVASQFHNVAVDLLLRWFGKWFGFGVAEKVVMSGCVLVFFWGAFAFITAAAKKSPWFLLPVLAMVAYGYTFEMGFLNYYLSIGLAFFALSFALRGSGRNWIAAGVLAILVFLAHPVGLLLLVGILLYFKLAQAMHGWQRVVLFALALLAVLGVRLYLTQFRVFFYETRMFYLFNGADQIMLFGKRYTILFFALFAFLALSVLWGLKREWRSEARNVVRVPFELWVVMLFAAAVIPEVIFLPQYPAPLALFVSRATCVSAVFLLCMLAAFQPKIWHLASFAIFAAFFFTWLYQDTGELNAMELQAERLLAPLPYGTRILGTLGPHPGSRILFLEHMLDRACLGHCFTYGDYEPASGQFRIHVRPASRLATDSAEDVGQMELGQYVVKPQDLPLKQIYQCKVEDVDTLCIRDLQAGAKNCGDCNNPFYAFTHPPPVKH